MGTIRVFFPKIKSLFHGFLKKAGKVLMVKNIFIDHLRKHYHKGSSIYDVIKKEQMGPALLLKNIKIV